MIFLGTKDQLIPVKTAKYYQTVIQKVGSRCDLFLYEGAGHGFFNKDEYLTKTMIEAERFLESIDYLKK